MIRTEHYDEIIRFDIARSFFGKGYYWTTAYYIDGLLIDSGCAHCARDFYNRISHLSIQQIVNTHSHEDHIGANGLLQQKTKGLKIFAHPLALPVLKNPAREQPLHPYRKIMWGIPQPSAAKAVSEDQIISTNNYNFRVIYTPGHSPDHICLYEPKQQWLFSGDLFIGGKDRALRENYDIWQIIESLKLIAQLPIKILFPGSARVRKKPKDDLNNKITYLEDLGNKVLKMYDSGMEIKAIIKVLFKKPMFIELFTLGHFSRKHLIQSYLQKRLATL